jgi:putative SOS response-associated peptidase YedK
MAPGGCDSGAYPVHMCGRYVAKTGADGLVRFFVVDDRDPEVDALPPRYNVAPTDRVPVVVRADGQLVLSAMRWGLVPFWAHDPKVGSRMINARAESVADSRAFARSFEERRCLVPADGFYEWEKAGGRRLPWFVRRVDGDPIAFAGLWASWRDPAGRERRLVTCSIITTAANGVLDPIHDRMPVVLEREVWDAWLRPDSDLGDLRELLAPAPDEVLERHRVSTRVNRVGVDDPSLVDPVEEVDDEAAAAAEAAVPVDGGQPSRFD